MQVANKLTHWEYVTQHATAPRTPWTQADLVAYHYFNPHGLFAEKRRLDDRISHAVGQGWLKPGAILAYGSCNTHAADALHRLHRQSRFALRRHIVATVLQSLQRDIAAAQEVLRNLPVEHAQ